MTQTINIYCDESCHLERDAASFMVLGAVWCATEQVGPISERVRELKREFRLKKGHPERTPWNPFEEIKWTKVASRNMEFYRRLVDFFFDDDDLHFRAVVIDKRQLQHAQFSQTHDDWYYKMLFTMLEPIIDPRSRHCVYLDIKDTRSERKRAKLEQVLRNRRHDHEGFVIQRVQQIRSHESEIMQLADVLIGALAFHNRLTHGDLKNRPEPRSEAKQRLLERLKQRSGKSLETTTWLRESKLNILLWKPGSSS